MSLCVLCRRKKKHFLYICKYVHVYKLFLGIVPYTCGEKFGKSKYFNSPKQFNPKNVCYPYIPYYIEIWSQQQSM